MEYRQEFETRKDVFRVNVYHNKKTDEKVTMYFIPRTTPVTEDTIFDYCTKNKTWREKQAQQWCDEKCGKNKDKLKSLPFVAGGLQRDLKWFGDNAKALFEDYKRGLGVAVQPKNNTQNNNTQPKKNAQNGGDQEFQNKLKNMATLDEKQIVQVFNQTFGATNNNWRLLDAGYKEGLALMTADLTMDGHVYRGKPTVGKRRAQRNAILAFLEEKYGIDPQKEQQKHSPENEPEDEIDIFAILEESKKHDQEIKEEKEKKRREENGGLNFKLEEAVKASDLEEVKSLIQAGAQISTKDKDVLEIALDAEKINQDMVNFLVENGAKTEFPSYNYDGELDAIYSTLCNRMEDLDVQAVEALLKAGVDPWFDPYDKEINGQKLHGYGISLSVDDALADLQEKIKDCYIEEEEGQKYDPAEKIQLVYDIYGEEAGQTYKIIQLIEDAREGRLEVHQKAETKAPTAPVSEATQTEEVTTPLPIISDDKGMVHVAPAENLRQSAIFTMSLFDENGKETPIQVALVSDRATLEPNANVSQDQAGDLKDQVFLVKYSQAKEMIEDMKKNGKATEALQAQTRLNLFRNMGETSPITKPYGNASFAPSKGNER